MITQTFSEYLLRWRENQLHKEKKNPPQTHAPPHTQTVLTSNPAMQFSHLKEF